MFKEIKFLRYLSLYRKYRPKSFENVIGQDNITTTLKNQIKNGQIAHAYLFNGTRGTGKTSVAKIFAMSINCENPTNYSACGVCNTCKAMAEQNNIDILEIDAASNNRVDEIRDLREKVKYPPVNGKYKVYIVDEVHMLTDSAFNALLKTLEEPPHYVVFILATTEVQKLPATILSRCLRFDFKLVSTEDLEKHLERIFTDSKIKFEKEALALIASLGEGSVRDALSVAEMCVAFSNSNVTYDSVLKAVGAIDRKTLFSLGESILKLESNQTMAIIDSIIKLGKNVNQIAKDLSVYYRDLAIIKTTNNYEQILNMPKDLLALLEKTAKEFDIETILKALKSFSSLENEFRVTLNPRLLLEVTALTLQVESGQLASLQARIAKLESGMPLESKDKQTADKKVERNIEIAPVAVTTYFAEDDVELIDLTPIQAEPEGVFYMDISADQEWEDISELTGVVELSKLNSKNIHGKLMVYLRKNNEYMLHSILGTITSFSFENNKFIIYVNDEAKLKTLQKASNIELINKQLKSINPSIEVDIKKIATKSVVGTNSNVIKLAEMFGDKFTIQ